MVKRQDASTGEIVEDNTAPAKPVKKELLLQVKIYSPFKVYFNDVADSVSAENDTGPFDVLPKHHNFMSLLHPCDLIIRRSNKEQRIRITRGIMHVRQDHVTVFLDV
jgi:F0F1-type ATP synthase epsilon subunit